MKETDFNIEFIKWVYENKQNFIKKYGNAGGIELKVTDRGTFNLKQWRNKQPHQFRSLKQVSGKDGLIWKIADSDVRTKPLDITFCFDGAGLLVILFNKWKEFFIIPIQDVPETDSISYDYCRENFKSNKLLPKQKTKIYVF